MDLAMSKSNHDDSIDDLIRLALDDDTLSQVLAELGDGDFQDDAVRALREVFVDEILEVASAASKHARRRGRRPTGDDIADVMEKRMGDASKMYAAMDPKHVKIESG